MTSVSSRYAAVEAAYAKALIAPPKAAGQLPRVAAGLLGAVRLQQFKVDELGDRGAEDRAALNLGRALAGLPPVGPRAGQLPAIGHWFDGAGSGNIPLMEAVAEYIRALREDDGPALWRARDILDAFFARSKCHDEPGGWMLSEIGSRIYTRWHLLPIAALAWAANGRGGADGALAFQSRAWLAQWLAWARLTQAPSGRLLYVGMRSGGHPPHPGFLEIALAVGLSTGQEGRWLAASQGTGQGLSSWWEYQAVIDLLRPTLRVAGEAVAAAGGDPAKLLAACPRWPLWPRAEFHFASWGKAGHACWCAAEINRNKGPIPGAVEVGGKITWLPTTPARGDEPEKPGGERLVKGEDAGCRREGGRLLYDSDVQGEQSADLPAGEPAWEVVWDHEGARIA